MNNELIHDHVVGMTSPLISVVLPVYNGEKYLGEAIDSILAQTFKDFELIIIDDGSTDNSLAVLKHYDNKDNRIRLISRENRNLATTLNDSIDLARGEWVARMDQDDIALPHRFERQLQWLEQTGADICGSWIKFFGTTDRDILKHCNTDEAIKMEMLFAAPFSHPTVMMKTGLLKKLMYDKDWEKAEDYDLWERAARSGWTMSNVPEVLLMYRKHCSQVSVLSANKQQELTVNIQKRYAGFIARLLDLDESVITDVVSMYDPYAHRDMNSVDEVFRVILSRCSAEARQEIINYALRLYIQVAVDCPDIISRWTRLNAQIGNIVPMKVKLKFWMIQLFRIRYGTRSFAFIKKLYLSFSRCRLFPKVNIR